MNNTVNIAIAEDHKLFREGVSNIIQAYKNFRVIIQAVDGSDLLKQLSETEVLPQICILDIEMKPLNGYDTAKAISMKYPSIKILALSMYNMDYAIIRMFKNGACGFLTKDVEPSILFQALNQIISTGFYIPDEYKPILIQGVQSQYDLNERELQFLSLCCSEMHYKNIADIMNLSERTVESYRDGLFRKLNIKTRTGLVMFAIKSGMGYYIYS